MRFGLVLYSFGMSWNRLWFQFEPKVGKNWTKPDLQTLLHSREALSPQPLCCHTTGSTITNCLTEDKNSNIV
jgi:hypothetical protein